MHAVIGAGSLGRATVAALVESGTPTRLISGSGRSAPGAEAVAADARDLSSLIRGLQDAEVVYQCAQPPYHRRAELQRRVLRRRARPAYHKA